MTYVTQFNTLFEFNFIALSALFLLTDPPQLRDRANWNPQAPWCSCGAKWNSLFPSNNGNKDNEETCWVAFRTCVSITNNSLKYRVRKKMAASVEDSSKKWGDCGFLFLPLTLHRKEITDYSHSRATFLLCPQSFHSNKPWMCCTSTWHEITLCEVLDVNQSQCQLEHL